MKGNSVSSRKMVPFLLVSFAVCLWMTEASWSWAFPRCAHEYYLSAWFPAPEYTAETASPPLLCSGASPGGCALCRQRHPRFSDSQSLWHFCAFLCHWASASGCGAIAGFGCTHGGLSSPRSAGLGLPGRVSGVPCCVWCSLADYPCAAAICFHLEASAVACEPKERKISMLRPLPGLISARRVANMPWELPTM